MGIPVLILGESGSGKSASLRNFGEKEICIVNVVGKPLPFKSSHKTLITDDYIQIEESLKAAPTKAVVIDDCQYLMANEYMKRAKESGFQKFTDIGLNFWTLLQVVIRELPLDTVVYFLGHVDRDNNGNEKLKTIGKMLDEKITIEGLFTIILKTHVQDGNYYFATKTSGYDIVKTPMEMFDDLLIDNDLKAVDSRIREYYELGTKKKEEK